MHLTLLSVHGVNEPEDYFAFAAVLTQASYPAKIAANTFLSNYLKTWFDGLTTSGDGFSIRSS